MGNAFQKKTDIPEQFLKPQGLYPRCDWDERTVRKMIVNKTLAPCFPGKDETELPPDSVRDMTLEECPICMLNYPGGLNRCLCCTQPICTECYLQIKKPKHGIATCPFCNATNYSAQYRGPKSKKQIEEEQIEQQRVLELQLKSRREQEEASQREREERQSTAGSGNGSDESLRSSRNNSDLHIEELAETENNQQQLETESCCNNLTESVQHQTHAHAHAHLREYIPDEAPEGLNPEEVEEWMLNQAIRMSLAQSDDTSSHDTQSVDRSSTTAAGQSQNPNNDEELLLAIALSMSLGRDSS